MDREAADKFSFDVVVVGAGPTGLACGIDVKRAGLSVTNIDKGCLVNSLFNYPSNMTFFTTPELLEIGDIPFSSPNQKPTRQEALEYYRKVAEHYQLDVRQYEPVQQIEGSDNNFVVHTTNIHGHEREYRARKLILATGYYDRPNYINVPGENLPKVMHYYREPHPFFNLNVLVVGAKELSRDCRAGIVASRRARDDGASRAGNFAVGEVLDQARHREPHQGRTSWPRTSTAACARSRWSMLCSTRPRAK
jgi:putative YpdA family bacillithiol system oxidoreductase